jgi:plasmid rolling circle replication initiator protein Rep
MSDRILPSGESAIDFSVALSPDHVTIEAPALSDLSPGDKPWDKHRKFADRVQSHYNGSEFQAYSNRVQECSQLIGFGLTMQENNSPKLKLQTAKFCRVRHCPVCQWRRSLMWKAKAYKILPRIVEAYPSYRFLFLTLTIKNTDITTLKQTLKGMNSGFQRLSQLKLFPAIGWLRSTEVTRGRDGNAHPHFHCLLLVPSSYFGNKYLKQSDWVSMWRKSMRLDYNPVLDIQAVKNGSTPMELIPELLKYCTKESDMVADRLWFLELTRQMFRVRSIATGGVLKQYLKELEEDPEDLIGEGDLDPDREKDLELFFGWRRNEKRYRLVDH